MKEICLWLSKRFLRLLSILLAVSLLTFILIDLSPIDPIQAYVQDAALTVSEQAKAALAEEWGLNQPFYQRFIQRWSHILRGDFGQSYLIKAPVLQVIWENFKVSLPLLLMAWLLQAAIGYALGLLASLKQGTFLDNAIKTYAMVLSAAPVFWVGLILMYILAVQAGWLPVSLSTPIGILKEDVSWANRLRHAILPLLTLVLTGTADYILYTRQNSISHLHSEGIAFAKTRGLSRRKIISQHLIPHTLPLTLVLMFTNLSQLLGGVVLVEELFSYPGLGQMTVQAGLKSDMPLLLAVVFFSVILIYLSHMISDLILYAMDPRASIKEVG